MISIKTTTKLNGITIQGDYDDLNLLYDAVSEYTNFFIDGIQREIEAEHIKEHGSVPVVEMTPEQRAEFFEINQSEITYFEEMRENILGLCYDIRHAYQGDRGIALIENGSEFCGESDEELPTENLQFEFEVLYPWAFYYLFVLQDMLDNMYKSEWLEGVGEYGVTYSEIDIELYRAVLSTFIALMWKNLEELFGKDFVTLYDYFRNKDGSEFLSRAYLTGICNYLVADHCEELSKTKYNNFKKNILLALAYDSMDADNLYDSDYSKAPYVVASKKQYLKAIDNINKVATLPYVTNHEFLSELIKVAVSDSENAAQEWITKIFGEADWEKLEW